MLENNCISAPKQLSGEKVSEDKQWTVVTPNQARMFAVVVITNRKWTANYIPISTFAKCLKSGALRRQEPTSRDFQKTSPLPRVEPQHQRLEVRPETH